MLDNYSLCRITPFRKLLLDTLNTKKYIYRSIELSIILLSNSTFIFLSLRLYKESYSQKLFLTSLKYIHILSHTHTHTHNKDENLFRFSRKGIDYLLYDVNYSSFVYETRSMYEEFTIHSILNVYIPSHYCCCHSVSLLTHLALFPFPLLFESCRMKGKQHSRVISTGSQVKLNWTGRD